MLEKNICILLYSSDQDAWLAFERLQEKPFNLKTVSIVGNGNTSVDQSTEVQPLGVYVLDEALHFQGKKGGFWESLWLNFSDRLFFLLPNSGALVAMGPIVRMMVETHDDIDIRSNLSVFGAALLNMGVPGDSIRRYEEELKVGKFLKNFSIYHNSIPTAALSACAWALPLRRTQISSETMEIAISSGDSAPMGVPMGVNTSLRRSREKPFSSIHCSTKLTRRRLPINPT